MTDIDLGLGDLPAENSKPANIGSFENLPSVADLAREIGYSGSLAVDAIEDRIRFYQHKTVEAALETGKFLLLLKSATKHGEFQDRVDALGFSCRSASRFMNAFMRASKNAKLLAIAHSAKNVSAFLEILTLEDDDIQNILELDDLDRLSASQLRELARKLRLDKTAAQERANIAEQRAARLERGYAVTDPRISRDLVITRAYCAGAEKTAAIKLDALLDGFRRAASSDAEDARAQIEQQWVTANAIAARALDALRRMQEESPIPLPERITGEHVMTPEEADRWHRDAQLIVNADAMERARIAAQVDGEEPKRRGRPRKTAE